MSFIQRIRGWAPPILEAPRDPADYLLHRIDGSVEPVPQGTSLTVRKNEIAALVVDSYVTNVLAPGIYRLDREHLGELEAIFSWPVDYAGAIGADVYFVSSVPAKRHLWQSRPGEEINIDGSAHAFCVSGTIDFTIADYRRFLSCQIEGGRHDDTVIRRSLDRLLFVELRALITEPGCDIDALTANPRDTARALTKRIAPMLDKQGIDEFSIRVRRLELEPRDAPVEPLPSPESTPRNVTPLPLNQREPDTDIEKHDPVMADGDPAGIDVLLDIERELEKLDAWSSIAQGHGQMNAEDIPTPATEQVNSQVIRPRLPRSLRDLGFYIAVDMEQSGPFDADEFEQAVGNGSVEESTLIWFRGLDDWKPAAEVPEIATLIEEAKFK